MSDTNCPIRYGSWLEEVLGIIRDVKASTSRPEYLASVSASSAHGLVNNPGDYALLRWSALKANLSEILFTPVGPFSIKIWSWSPSVLLLNCAKYEIKAEICGVYVILIYKRLTIDDVWLTHPRIEENIYSFVADLSDCTESTRQGRQISAVGWQLATTSGRHIENNSRQLKQTIYSGHKLFATLRLATSQSHRWYSQLLCFLTLRFCTKRNKTNTLV